MFVINPLCDTILQNICSYNVMIQVIFPLAKPVVGLLGFLVVAIIRYKYT